MTMSQPDLPTPEPAPPSPEESTDIAPEPPEEPTTGFADLGLRAELLAALAAPRLRGADADPARGHPASCSPAATCSARPPPAPARPRRSPCRSSSASAGADGRAAADRPGAGAHPRAGRAGLRGDLQVRPRPRRPGAADLRRPADRPPAPGAAARASHVVVATPGRALDHISRGTLPLDGVERGGARRGRRDARHGLRRGHRGDPRGRPPPTARRCCSRPPCRRASTAIAQRHLTRPGPHPDRRAASPTPAPPRWCARRAYVVARAHKAAALGRILDVEAPDGGHRLLPHPHRGRPAHRDAQRPGLPGRGAARRHEPGAARPGDGPAAHRHRRAARRHRRRRPRPRRRPAHPRRQLRRAVGARVLRAPHRPRRPGRARGRGHHPRRAPRAPPARQHRAAHRADDHRSRRSRRSPTSGPARWSSPSTPLREALEADDLDRFRPWSTPSPTSSTSATSRWPR